jgi:hypothetical protein
VKTGERVFGFVFGQARPGLVAGRAATRGTRQTELSRMLRPPMKWSYVRLAVRAVLVTVPAFIACVIFVIVSNPPVSSLPVKLYVFLAPVFLLLLVFLIWRHNHTTFPREYAQWNRSFISGEWYRKLVANKFDGSRFRRRVDLTNDRNLCVFRPDGVFGNHRRSQR